MVLCTVNTLLCWTVVWPFSLCLDKNKAFAMLYRLGQEQNLCFPDTDKRSTKEKYINTSPCHYSAHSGVPRWQWWEGWPGAVRRLGLNKDRWRGANVPASPLHLLSTPVWSHGELTQLSKKGNKPSPMQIFLTPIYPEAVRTFFSWLKALPFLCKQKNSKLWGKKNLFKTTKLRFLHWALWIVCLRGRHIKNASEREKWDQNTKIMLA